MTTELSSRLAEILSAAGIENASNEARWIANDAADPQVAVRWAERRAKGEPLQYILGSVAFRQLDLEIGPGAFIPRPETEQVAGRAIELLPTGGTAVDLCTGSGAIAVSIAHERPDAKVYATEISKEALGWARRNVGSRDVILLEGDLFDPLPSSLKRSIDVVVANPPYIAPIDARTLPSDVVEHEPHVALFASGKGSEVIAEICARAGGWLCPGGRLVMEIGETQGEEVRRLLSDAGFEDVVVSPDLAGKDRIAEGRCP